MYSKPALGYVSDGLMLASLIAWSYYIPRIPGVPIPVSPQVYCPLIWAAFLYFTAGKDLVAALRQPLMCMWGVIVGYMVLVDFLAIGFNYETVSSAARLAAGFTFVACLAQYVSIGRRNVIFVLGASVLVMGFSSLWYIAELAIAEPFRSLRFGLYEVIYSGKDSIEHIEEFSASGLAPFVHSMGYQICVLLVVSILGFLLRSRLGALRAFGFRGACLAFALVGMVAVEFSSQRSAVLAVAISVVPALAYGGSLRRLLPAFFLIAAFALAVVGLKQADMADSTRYLQGVRAIDKLLSTEVWEDNLYRVELQVEAVRVICAYPLGLLLHGEKWEEVAFKNGSKSDITDPQGNMLAPHNGYLTVGIKYGVLFFFFSLLWVCLVLRAAWRLLRVRSVDSVWIIGASLVLGLFTVQTMTHNGGVLNMEPACLAAFGMLVGTWLNVYKMGNGPSLAVESCRGGAAS